MESLFGILFLAIQARLSTELSEELLRFIDLELGQLENYTPGAGKPKVSWPCALIDIDNFNFEEEGEHTQRAVGNVVIRIGFEPVSSTDNLTPTARKENALRYFEIEKAINDALHGWTPGEPFGLLIREKAGTEKRNDHYRVRVMSYSLTFSDNSTLIDQDAINKSLVNPRFVTNISAPN